MLGETQNTSFDMQSGRYLRVVGDESGTAEQTLPGWASFEVTNQLNTWRTVTYRIGARVDSDLELVLGQGRAVVAPRSSRRIVQRVDLPAGLDPAEVTAHFVETGERRACAISPRPFILSVVIPALNEEQGIARVLQEVPVHELNEMGYEVEILVIDNGSVDQTPDIAREHGVSVICQPVRGYGNAYKAGFANASGDVIVTGDADCTYPFSALPSLLEHLEGNDLDFISTDRLSRLRPGVMSFTHQFGNWFLTAVCRWLFDWPFRDSQSGMWVVRNTVLDELSIRSSGMPFSQEVKIRAWRQGWRCDEVPIDYRARAGEEKLNTIRDGTRNLIHLASVKLGL